MLRIKKTVIKAITDHALRDLPQEACGYLAGDKDRITLHYELTNMDKAADHFSMEPSEQFAAVKDMRNKGLVLRAVYHSHPETPARPSEEDIRLAYDPDLSFVIISLAEKAADIRSFLINSGSVQQEDVEIIE